MDRSVVRNGAAPSEVALYQFRAHWTTCGRSEPLVCIGERGSVEAHVSRSDLGRLFHGYLTGESPDGRRFIGVRGARNCSRFRRLLRERGAQVQVIETEPAGFELRGESRRYGSSGEHPTDNEEDVFL